MNSIVRTLSISIDGDTHQYLMKKFKNKDGIKTNEQNRIYKSIHDRLYEVQKINKTGSTIYTLVYDSLSKEFQYGVSSSAPFYRHVYKEYPQILKDKFKKGAIIPLYKTENGEWISAFAPIFNSKNEVVAVVEADVSFMEFIRLARAKIFTNIGYSGIVILLIALLLYRSVKRILKKEEQVKRLLISQKKVIEEKNKDITDSINYAKKIQESILPSKKQIDQTLPKNFILYMPRDIVSGDFYWYYQFTDGSKVIVVGDCTGHGIPGALMSVIGCSLLNEIVKQQQVKSPAEILKLLDEGVSRSLGNDGNSDEQLDGMDVSICYINSAYTELVFSAALRPLLQIRNNQIIEYKGNRFPIGGGTLYQKKAFDETVISIQKDDLFYMYTDGYIDQFGGENGKKLRTKNFKEFLLENKDLAFSAQSRQLENFINAWKGAEEQNDDILVLGFAL